MKALLIDRNSFVKWLDIPYPPLPNYIVPIRLGVGPGRLIFRLTKLDMERDYVEYEEYERDE